jgi:hypothetical protein
MRVNMRKIILFKTLIIIMFSFSIVAISSCTGSTSRSTTNNNPPPQSDLTVAITEGIVNHQENVSLTPIIILKFSKKIQINSLSDRSIILTDKNKQSIPLDVKLSDDLEKVTLSTKSELSELMFYSLNINNKVLSIDGMAANPTSFDFTTIGNVTVKFVDYAMPAVGVLIKGDLKFKFDTVMENLSAQTVKLLEDKVDSTTPDNNALIKSTGDGQEYALSYSQVASLKYGTKYYIKFSSEIKSAKTKKPITPIVLEFNTESRPKATIMAPKTDGKLIVDFDKSVYADVIVVSMTHTDDNGTVITDKISHPVSSQSKDHKHFELNLDHLLYNQKYTIKLSAYYQDLLEIPYDFTTEKSTSPAELISVTGTSGYTVNHVNLLFSKPVSHIKEAIVIKTGKCDDQKTDISPDKIIITAQDNNRQYLIGGVFSGSATSTKYYCVTLSDGIIKDDDENVIKGTSFTVTVNRPPQ